jgi:hypothetical protein
VFVISDIFDLARIGRFRRVDWSENLLCGVAAHGVETLGYQAAARWLLDATRQSGLVGEMEYAGYDRLGEGRTRNIQVASFEKLARGELRGAKDTVGLLLHGEREATGCQRGSLLVGGIASERPRRRAGPNGSKPIVDYPYRPFDADFCFPASDRALAIASALLRQSAELMDAEYGYYFVMDEMSGPSTYARGMAAPLDWSQATMAKTNEVSAWYYFVMEGRLWTDPWPLLRDLFELNLISERHTSVQVDGLGYLTDWIRAQPGRGTLEDIGRGRLIWRLSSAEMFNTRPLLNAAGLLFSCQERVYRDLTPNFRDAWETPP